MPDNGAISMEVKGKPLDQRFVNLILDLSNSAICHERSRSTDSVDGICTISIILTPPQCQKHYIAGIGTDFLVNANVEHFDGRKSFVKFYLPESEK